MAWRDAAESDDLQIIRQGTTHHAFVATARSLLMSGLASALASRMHTNDAHAFRTGMRTVNMRAQLGQHPFAEMIQALDSWVGQLVDQFDEDALNSQIPTSEQWMDHTLDRILRSARDRFAHHF